MINYEEEFEFQVKRFIDKPNANSDVAKQANMTESCMRRHVSMG